MDEVARVIADAIIGIDTLWGGDVMCPSGTGRFIADSWFSDDPLPPAYTHPAAARLRASGGVSGKNVERGALEQYMRDIDIPGAIAKLERYAKGNGDLRGAYLAGLAGSVQIMWELAQEILGHGKPVPYATCVEASTGSAPGPSHPESKRERLAALLGKMGHRVSGPGELLQAVDSWRRERLVPMASVRALSGAVIAYFDKLSGVHLAPHLPPELADVPRANIEFLPIKDAWFSGSMNYVGRARQHDGAPNYEATYEINASLQISVPEFQQLISHEVVPGHVTTFAYLQNLYVRGLVGFESTVLTMNTPFAALCEGIANNAILIAHGVTEVDQLPDDDMQIGVLLALLQDDAKNQASFLTWAEGRPQAEVAATLRRDYLVTEERADKLSGPWGRHPLLGRMYMPAYRAGTEKVAEMRRRFSDAQVLPVLYGCFGLVDIITIDKALESQGVAVHG